MSRFHKPSRNVLHDQQTVNARHYDCSEHSRELVAINVPGRPTPEELREKLLKRHGERAMKGGPRGHY